MSKYEPWQDILEQFRTGEPLASTKQGFLLQDAIQREHTTRNDATIAPWLCWRVIVNFTETLEYPTIARIEEIKKRFAHMYIYHLSSNNTAWLTLNYPPGLSLYEANTAFELFMDALTKEVGLASHGLAWFGCILERNSQGKVWPHMHLVVHSKRSRKTGRTVASLAIFRVKKLQRLWERLVKWEDPTSKGMWLERISDATYLPNYILGPDNLQAPNQRYRIVEHNIKLLDRRALQSAA